MVCFVLHVCGKSGWKKAHRANPCTQKRKEWCTHKDFWTPAAGELQEKSDQISMSYFRESHYTFNLFYLLLLLKDWATQGKPKAVKGNS